jgi:hypothetical protein
MPNSSALIDELIAKTPGWRGAAVAKLRKLIHDADPEITEEVKWRRPSNPLGAAVFEHNGMVCLVGVLKDRVRLSVVAGSTLPDPHHLFNAMLVGKTRAIDISEGDKLNETALKALIRAGVEQNLGKEKPAGARKK